MPLSAHRHPHAAELNRVPFAGTSHFLHPVLATPTVVTLAHFVLAKHIARVTTCTDNPSTIFSWRALPNSAEMLSRRVHRGAALFNIAQKRLTSCKISNVKYICFLVLWSDLARRVTLSRLNQQVHSDLSSTEHNYCVLCTS